jgi:hypothetical protein
MISTSDDLYSVFLADLSEKERDRVRRYADRFGIEPTDAVWALMIVLGWYGDLYEAVPQKINVTVQGILEKIQSVAAAEAESSRVRLQASLTDAVVGAAESVAARNGRRELVKWSAIASAAAVFMLACVFVTGYWLGFRSRSRPRFQRWLSRGILRRHGRSPWMVCGHTNFGRPAIWSI